MSKKNTHTILRIIGVIIMLIAFIVIPDAKPWYYEVLLFDFGLILTLIPKFPKIRKSFQKQIAQICNSIAHFLTYTIKILYNEKFKYY